MCEFRDPLKSGEKIENLLLLLVYGNQRVAWAAKAAGGLREGTAMAARAVRRRARVDAVGPVEGGQGLVVRRWLV
eukprot:4738397-Prymnesium_polylepis.1